MQLSGGKIRKMDPDIETSRAKILALNEAVDVSCIDYTTNWEFFPDQYYTICTV